MATIREVARHAGVSVSTVSRVISDHPDVSPETREKVRRVVEEMRFAPSALARGLIRGNARIIGLVVSDVTNPFYPELLRSVEQRMTERGYTIILCSTEDDPDQAAASIQVLREYRADGVIHASSRLDDPLAASLDGATGLPVVFVNRIPDNAHPSVTADNYQGGVLATEHLLELGRRQLIHLAGPPWASNAVARRKGFEDTVRHAGLPDDAWRVVEVGFMVEPAREVIRDTLRSAPLPDAIFAVNDSIAIAAMEELAGQGLRIPEDVAVIGFDDTHLSASRFIRLSTVAHNVREMGLLASDMLLDAIEQTRPDRPQQVVLPPKLIVRGSTVRQEEEKA